MKMMKNIFALQLMFLVACSGKIRHTVKPFDKHLGTWSFSIDGKKGQVFFLPNNEFKFIVNGKTYGGKNFKNSNGTYMECRYNINVKTTPKYFYMYTMERNDLTKKKKGLKVDFRLFSENKMELRFNFPTQDSTVKSYVSNEAIILTRM
jgi:hypothetical protein